MSALPEIGAFNGREGRMVTALNDRHRQRLASVDLKRDARRLLRERLRPDVSGLSLEALDVATPETRMRVEQIARGVVHDMQTRGAQAEAAFIPPETAAEAVDYLLAWQFGCGPLEPLFAQADVEDIVLNTRRDAVGELHPEVFTYRQSGKQREQIDITADEILDLVNRNASSQGRTLNASAPILNAQMRNGARLNAVCAPLCDPGLSVTIRIHRLIARSFDDLVGLGTLTQAAADWLWLSVRSGLAIVVGGGTSSGKTNFLNAVARVMEPDLRVVAIEDTRELDLAVADCVYLTTASSPDGIRAHGQRQLVANALRMRPDRIVLGEVRDAAAWDAVKATNTGHDGTLLTVHAEDADSVALRLAQLCSEAPETMNIPERTLRQLIASAFQVVVFLERRRMPNGAFQRRVTAIHELNGLIGEGAIHRTVVFEQRDGALTWTGNWPHDRIKRRIHDAGFTQSDIEAALQGRLRKNEGGRHG
jgi:pilus assembly protein CpaF